MDVGAWLKELGLAEHAEAFAANGIDSAMLAGLTNDDLKDLGIVALTRSDELEDWVERGALSCATLRGIAARCTSG